MATKESIARNTTQAKDLELVMANIRKTLGNDDLVFKGSEMPHITHLSTGWLSLDFALGGGFPKNQWTEIVGLESHGKTATVLKCIAHNQRLDPNFTVAWIAAEHYSNEYAEMCGVDNSRVVIIDTNVMEDAYEAVDEFALSRSVDMIVIDSYPALVPISEDEGAMEDFQVGIGARLTGKWTRKARRSTRRSVRDDERAITGVMINQWRTDIAVRMGDNRTTPGGKGKNYFFYTRVEIRRDEWLEPKKGNRVGITIMARPFKHKAGRPEVRASVDFYFADHNSFHAGEYDVLKDIVATGIASGAIPLSGSYYKFGGQQWQGRAKLEADVYQDLDLQSAISDAVIKSSQLALPAPDSEPVPEEAPRRRKRKPKT